MLTERCVKVCVRKYVCMCVYEGVTATSYTAGSKVVEIEAGGKLQMRISGGVLICCRIQLPPQAPFLHFGQKDRAVRADSGGEVIQTSLTRLKASTFF